MDIDRCIAVAYGKVDGFVDLFHQFPHDLLRCLRQWRCGGVGRPNLHGLETDVIKTGRFVLVDVSELAERFGVDLDELREAPE